MVDQEKLVELGTRTNTGWAKKCLWDGIVQVEALVLFQVLDYDTGLELLDGGDDLLGRILLASFLLKPMVEYNHSVCDESGCFENDMPLSLSLSWGLQRRKRSVAKKPGFSLNANASVRVVIEIVPFQVHVVEGEDFLTTEFIAFIVQHPLLMQMVLFCCRQKAVSRSANAQVALNAQVGLYAELSINADAADSLSPD